MTHPTDLPADARDAEERAAVAADAPDGALDAFKSEADAGSPPPPTPDRRRPVTWRSLVFAGLLLIALAEAAALAVVSVRWYPGRPGVAVEIAQAPEGTDFLVDGVSRGRGPLRLDARAASHRIELRDARPLATSGTEGPPGGGSLLVMSEPAGAEVLVDGARKGTSPVALNNVPSGSHTVLIRGAAGAATRTVMVREGQTAAVNVRFNEPALALAGWLRIRAAVPLDIHEDGRLVGSTETERLMLPTGRHDLELSNDELGFRTRRTVQIDTARTTALQIDLPQGTLSLNALPWADVWIDGERVGQTPIGNVARPIGPHEVVFRHPSLGERRQTVVVTTQQTRRVGVDLRTGNQR